MYINKLYGVVIGGLLLFIPVGHLTVDSRYLDFSYLE